MGDLQMPDCVCSEQDGGKHQHQYLRRNGRPKKYKGVNLSVLSPGRRESTGATISWCVLSFFSYTRDEVRGSPRLLPPFLNLTTTLRPQEINTQGTSSFAYQRVKTWKQAGTNNRISLERQPQIMQRLVLTNKVEHHPPSPRNPPQEEKT